MPEGSLQEENAKVLIELLMDPDTPLGMQTQIINKLLEHRKDQTFFTAMYAQKLSYGACPKCRHENFWLIPEDELNKAGYVSSEFDERVKPYTTGEDCEKWGEACKKKKATI